MPTTPNKSNAIKYGLIVLSLLGFFLAYSKNNDYNNLKKVLTQDKQDLELELNTIVEDYKKLNIKSKKLSRRVISEINKIIILKDSVKKLEVKNYDLIRYFRKKTAKLQKENRLLLAKVDSLNTENRYLKIENLFAKETLNEKKLIADKLKRKNNSLNRKNAKLKEEIEIAPSKEIKTSVIRAMAMREKSNGSLDVTNKYNKVDAFRINFKLLKNNLTNSRDVKIHIQIVNEDQKVISAKSNYFTLKNGERINYSDELVVDYTNEQLDILSLILVDRNIITKGEYKVNVFIDGNYSSSSLLTL